MEGRSAATADRLLAAAQAELDAALRAARTAREQARGAALLALRAILADRGIAMPEDAGFAELAGALLDAGLHPPDDVLSLAAAPEELGPDPARALSAASAALTWAAASRSPA